MSQTASQPASQSFSHSGWNNTIEIINFINKSPWTAFHQHNPQMTFRLEGIEGC